MRFRAILICLLFLTLTTKTKAVNAYEPVHGLPYRNHIEFSG